jgi:hypothetical protein
MCQSDFVGLACQTSALHVEVGSGAQMIEEELI